MHIAPGEIDEATYLAWLDHLDRLLSFRKQEDSTGWVWLCGKEGDSFFYAKEAANAVGAAFESLLLKACMSGVIGCDCEILVYTDD